VRFYLLALLLGGPYGGEKNPFDFGTSIGGRGRQHGTRVGSCKKERPGARANCPYRGYLTSVFLDLNNILGPRTGTWNCELR